MTVETRFSDTMREFLERCEIVDLTHPLEEGIPSHPEHSRYFHDLWNSYWHGEESVTYQVLLNEHTGTHVDAPAHFVRDGNKSHLWIDELPPTQLWGPCSVIDVRGYAGRQIYDIDVLDRFEANHGEVKPGGIVLFNTGWSSKWALRPGGREYLTGWPGPTEVLCQRLVERRVKAVGCDNMGLDSHAPTAHSILLGSAIPIMENLKGLDRLPQSGAYFMAQTLPIKGGSGSPIRALCLVPREP